MIRTALRRGRRLARQAIDVTRSVALRGTDVECTACGWQGRQWPNKQCPRCHSLARHRLIGYSARTLGLVTTGRDILHIGPNELEIQGVERLGRNRSYLKTDLRWRPFLDMLVDGTAIPLRDGSIDVAVIWHVLEHIPNDRGVIAELYRVLRPGGALLVSVPIYPTGREKTDEDPSVPASARLATYGHEDHVRACGLDYVERFRDAGFRTTTLTVADASHDDIMRYGLSPSRVAWLCTR